MAVTVENSLSGPVGVEPSDATLATTARAGTVTVADPGRATYSAGATVHALSTVEVATGHHRDSDTTDEGIVTPRLAAALPSAPWAVRCYVRLPGMQAAGHGGDEVRWLLDLGDYGLVIHETTGGNVGLRLQPSGLAASGLAPTYGGDPMPIDQVTRVEVTCDGADTACAVYAGHGTTGARTATWSGTIPSGGTVALTAYRYRRGVLLQPGMNDANLDGTPIEDRQNQLLDWDPSALPQFGADGDYGSETTEWVENFQTAHGFALVDGEIGPETGAAMDLAQQIANGSSQPPPTYVSHLAVADAATEIGPAAAPAGDAVATMGATATTDGIKGGVGTAIASLGAVTAIDSYRGGPALGALGVSGLASGAKATAGTAEGALGLSGTASGSKAAAGTAVATLGLVGTVQGFKSAEGSAVAALGVLARADQLIELIPPLAGVAIPDGHPRAEATPSGRPSAAATRPYRLGGTIGRGY